MDTISLYKHRIDALMDILFGAGVSNPQTIIEQLNYLLFLRALSIKDDEAELLGITDESEKIFTGDLAKYRWQNLLALNAEDLFKTLESSFDVLQKNSKNPTVKLLFRNAHVKIFDKPTLRRVLHEIEEFAKELDKISHGGNKDVFGDMYEYLLSKLSSAGTNGQFRTPRHIIDFIVRVVAPKKNETILDPACGTAGFLVAAYRYLAEEYTSDNLKKAGSPRAMDKLTSDEKNFLFNHMFTGFDSDEDMIKFGMMNLHLHGLTKSKLERQNTLTDTAGVSDKFDVVLANPPFSGSIDRESVAGDLKMGTTATEVLFLRFMLDHLSSKGKIGVIVPQGVVFGDTKAHVKIREMLIEKGLWCVISLPAGIFNPYSGTVTTSILFVDRATTAKPNVLFYRIEADGFDLGSQRSPISPNDLPDALEVIQKFKNDKPISNNTKLAVVPKSEVLARAFKTLSADAYIENVSSISVSSNGTKMVALRDVLEQVKEPITIQDNKLYQQATVKLYGKGVELRQEVLGSKIKTKRQFVAHTGLFLISKIDARNGAFGIVPPELDGCVVSQDFPVFSFKPGLITQSYLKRITRSKKFSDLCAKSSLGTTNRKRLKVELFLDSKIPLPSMKEQMKIDDLVRNVDVLTKEIRSLEVDLDNRIGKLWA